MEPDGKREVVVANAPNPKESFYHNQAKAQRKGSAVAAWKQLVIGKESVRTLDAGAAVQFSFPNGPKQFDATKRMVMTEVTEGGKTNGVQ